MRCSCGVAVFVRVAKCVRGEVPNGRATVNWRRRGVGGKRRRWRKREEKEKEEEGEGGRVNVVRKQKERACISCRNDHVPITLATHSVPVFMCPDVCSATRLTGRSAYSPLARCTRDSLSVEYIATVITLQLSYMYYELYQEAIARVHRNGNMYMTSLRLTVRPCTHHQLVYSLWPLFSFPLL